MNTPTGIVVAAIVTAIGTWALVIGTIIAIRMQIRDNRIVSGVSLIMQMAREYATDYRDTRRRVSRSIQRKKKKILNQDDYFLLSFFETLGYLARRGMVDKEMIWNEFSIKILGWWPAYEEYIADLRKKDEDETLYEEFEYLYNEILALETKRRHISETQTIFPGAKLQEFLNGESKC